MSSKGSFSFTKAQQRAIDTRGVSVAVSAAAGSGKTRVLVQRVIELLTSEHPVSADRLLILTFANKAADEMKTRISDALDELIEEDPSNDNYRRQQLLLDGADICTVHSFCGKVVRDNFFRLGISRDFRIGTENELRELRSALMSELIEEYYTPPVKETENYDQRYEMYKAFGTLSLLLSGSKLDSELEEELLTAYEKYTSHAFPKKWIDKCVSDYDPSLSLGDDEAARSIADSIEKIMPDLRKRQAELDGLRAALEERASAKKAPKTYTAVLDRIDAIDGFIAKAERCLSGNTDVAGLFEAVNGLDTSGFNASRLKPDDHRELCAAILCISGISEGIKEYKQFCCFTEDIFREDNKQLYPVMLCLRELLMKFDERYFAEKCRREMLDFDDLQRLMLRLLYEYDEKTGEYKRTLFAEELSLCYDEIMVDEYQDTNDVQEKIFKAVSRGEKNLFVVGDMKQSIYRFRNAMPELFKARCARAADKSDKDSELIILDKNFRSRKGVIDGVNFLFSRLMSEQAGEIDYDDTQKLKFGASYPDRDEEDVELHLIEYHKDDTVKEDEEDSDPDAEDDNMEKTEAAYCSGLISDMVKRGTPCRDICILLRSVKNKAKTYAFELERLGIPVYTDAGLDLLKKYEIRAALALMNVINNPMSDVDMTAVLMSPVFGFTPDDMAVLKDKNGRNYYKKLRFACTEEGELAERCKTVAEKLRSFRTLSGSMSVDKLMMRVFEETGFLAVMRAMPGGALREENLRRLIAFAAEYEAAAAGGLSGFVRHIRYLESTDEGIKVSDAAPPDAVRIMTIHHSKGLEFPVCILAGTKNRTRPDKDRVRYHSDAGIGLCSMDTDLMVKFDTFRRTYIKELSAREEKSEQLRILYVALTRAKEKLIMLSTIKTETVSQLNAPDDGSDEPTAYQKYLLNMYSKTTDGRIDPKEVLSSSTFSDLIVMCAIQHNSMDALREDAGILGFTPAGDDHGHPWKYVHIPMVEQRKQVFTRTAEDSAPDSELTAIIKERLRRRPVDGSTLVPSKVSASMLAHKEITDELVAMSKPDFVLTAGVSPTERGKATHTFLQHASLDALKASRVNPDALEKEKQRLVSQRLMSESQAELVSDDKVAAFAGSALFDNMCKAAEVRREYRFTVSIPGRLALAASPELRDTDCGDAKSILQGAIDCIIDDGSTLTIVDYKTDRVKDPADLADMYGLQLRLYKAAAEQLFGKPVSRCVIYSLHKSTEVELV